MAFEELQSDDDGERETLAALVHGAGFGVLDAGCAELMKHQLQSIALDHKPHTFRYGNGTSDQSIKKVQLPDVHQGAADEYATTCCPGRSAFADLEEIPEEFGGSD